MFPYSDSKLKTFNTKDIHNQRHSNYNLLCEKIGSRRCEGHPNLMSSKEMVQILDLDEDICLFPNN